jgi:FkbM family methyltransferase
MPPNEDLETAGGVAHEVGLLTWQFGHDLKALEEEWCHASGWQPANLRKDFAPSTVIDVGVAFGTIGLYEAFPDAHLVLIEPLEEYADAINRLVGRGEYHAVAVGAEDRVASIQVDTEAPWLSSVLTPTSNRPHASKPLAERQIQMTTIDALWDKHRWAPPFGLKIDTEGYEDQVVRGADRLLEHTEFVIAEVSLAPRFTGSYSFAEFIDLMDAHGFVVCDILEGLKSSRSGRVIFLDALFLRK